MRFKKKIPRKRWTWHFCFEIIKNIGQHCTSTQSASPQDWVWNCIYCFFYLFIHSLFIFLTKIGQHLLPLKVRHRNIELWIDLFKMYILIVISFFQLIWFILNTGMTFLFWNHSIIAQHVFTSTQSASPRDWVLNCMYVSLFIHSFIHLFIFFYYYLFVSLYLIYINQVWHFCFEIVQ